MGHWLEKTVVKWDWSWAERQKIFKLFGDETAPIRIADAILIATQNINETLESCGIGGNLQSGGMASVAFDNALKNIKTMAKNSDSKYVLDYLNRLLTWACVDGKTFNYPPLKTAFIDSLLLPWENNIPHPDIKAKIQSFLITCFGDPRIRREKWNGVSEEAMRIIRGWLVERALAQFLDVVDELALDHQWQYRRKFWMAYYNKNHISDAWVAFAGNGDYQAQKIARKTNDNSWLSFGKFYNSGDPDHAVLILKIGDVTIADYSHNGKCRIWNRGNINSPKPYEASYERDDLLHGNADSEYIHSSSQSYLWQGRVAAKISETTGVRLNKGDYTL